MAYKIVLIIIETPLNEPIKPRVINTPDIMIMLFSFLFLVGCAEVFLVCTVALKPIFETSEIISSTLLEWSIFILPVEKLTLTLLTEGWVFKWFSMLLAQLPQSIPSISNVFTFPD
ncbi:hypothetical protein SRABI80_04347 [Peribacillus frigoritolerans]|nr:hypothetical protein SRABI80_04347 [Peribacillus frigoritolerans]